MSATRNLTTVGMLLNLCVTVTAAAASDPRSCARIDDDAARLACYDAAFPRAGVASGRDPAAAAGAASASTTATPAAPAPSVASAGAASSVAASMPVTAAPAATAKSTRDEFGLSEQEKRARAPMEEPPEPDSITGRISKVGARPTGELVVTFEDGQVWSQVQPEAKVRLKPGDEVTIRKASLGSYLLVTPSKLSTRVRRVK